MCIFVFNYHWASCAASWRGREESHDGDDSTVVDVAGVAGDRTHAGASRSDPAKSQAYAWIDLDTPWCDRPSPWLYWESAFHGFEDTHSTPVSILLSMKHTPAPAKGLETEIVPKPGTAFVCIFVHRPT